MLLCHSVILLACLSAASATFAADKIAPFPEKNNSLPVQAAGVESKGAVLETKSAVLEGKVDSASKTAKALKSNLGVTTTNYRPGPSSQSQLLKVMLALSGVLALIMGLAWVFKQFVQPMAQSAQKIQVLSSLSLGGKEKLVLTEVNGQQILLGVTAHGISALHSFPGNTVSNQQPADIAKDSDTQPLNKPVPESFKEKINQLMQQK